MKIHTRIPVIFHVWLKESPSSDMTESMRKAEIDRCIKQHIKLQGIWLVVEPTHLKNMLVKLDYFPK